MMIHKYKPCAWHLKKRRINETLGKMIAKKYNINYVKPSHYNKLHVATPRKIGRRIGDIVNQGINSMKQAFHYLGNCVSSFASIYEKAKIAAALQLEIKCITNKTISCSSIEDYNKILHKLKQGYSLDLAIDNIECEVIE